MQIGQVSELSGYSQRMIRFLEEQGLITLDRSDSNLREFKDSDLTRVLKIKNLKELGFTYVEIKDLIDSDEALLVNKGIELLKRHYEEAAELQEKIKTLESICYSSTKTQKMPAKIMALSSPQRTAYRIEKLDSIESILTNFSKIKSFVTFWKFGEFINEQRTQNRNIEIFEIFRESSQMMVLKDIDCFSVYEKAWAEVSLPLGAKSSGQFQINEASEFFANYEIIIEHRILDHNDELVFHAVLPYQAVYIASGEAIFS